MTDKPLKGGNLPIDRALRKAEAMGWSPSELARRLRVSAQAVHNWEKRRHLPSDMWESVADLLFNHSIDALLGRSEPPAIAAHWPFSTVHFDEFNLLDPDEKLHIEQYIEDRVRRIPASRKRPRKSL